MSLGELPDNRIATHKIQVQTARFSLVNGQLYKRSLDGPHLKCLTAQEGQYILEKLHEGICGNHQGGRTLAHRAHTQGYYWSTMRADAVAYVRECDHCQRQAPISRVSAQDLTTITRPWPFSQWGIDIVGPFPTAPAHKKLLLVATYYSSKWIDVEAFTSIKDKDVQFMWKNTVCRFGIPQSIVTNNGSQFDSGVNKIFFYELKIKNLYSTPWYQQSNGQAEACNKTLLTALKKRLHSAKGKGVDELLGVLWAYKTTSQKPTEVSSFTLTDGIEAIIPTEIGVPTLQTETPEKANTKAIAKDLDMIDAVAIHIASYQQRMTNPYNMHVK